MLGNIHFKFFTMIIMIIIMTWCSHTSKIALYVGHTLWPPRLLADDGDNDDITATVSLSYN